ncbi:MAG: hypothetical protein LBS69_05060 [Prevotellaceae bacterium]|jgi:hypothetical protein|nr:hypothetical protein [Prevotellaceae bacterium]
MFVRKKNNPIGVVSVQIIDKSGGKYKVLDIAKTITTVKIKLQESKETLSKTMLITPKHKSIAQIFKPNFWENS